MVVRVRGQAVARVERACGRDKGSAVVMAGCGSAARVRGQIQTGNCFLWVKLTALEDADLVLEALSSGTTAFV